MGTITAALAIITAAASGAALVLGPAVTLAPNEPPQEIRAAIATLDAAAMVAGALTVAGAVGMIATRRD
jgi:hypothetical protein